MRWPWRRGWEIGVGIHTDEVERLTDEERIALWAVIESQAMWLHSLERHRRFLVLWSWVTVAACAAEFWIMSLPGGMPGWYFMCWIGFLLAMHDQAVRRWRVDWETFIQATGGPRGQADER